MRKPIQIDALKSYNQADRRTFARLFRKEQQKLVESTCECAREWFADPNQPEWPDNQIDARLDLTDYVLDSLKPNTKGSKFFLPTSVWVWIATQVITYVVKVLIENYWSEIEQARI